LSAAQHAWDNCLHAAQALKADLSTAIDTCAAAIDRAASTRFKHNPTGWSGFTRSVTSFVKDHAGGLAKLSGVLKTVSMIAGVMSFIPVVNIVAGPIALATAGAALAIDVGLKLATGEGSWTGIGVDAALIVVPGAGKVVGKAVTKSLERTADTVLGLNKVAPDAQIAEAGGSLGAAKMPKFDASPKHGTSKRGSASAGPTNGQDVLDTSIRVKSTSPRRVGADTETGEYVVMDETREGCPWPWQSPR
jgi:hypothetical protein